MSDGNRVDWEPEIKVRASPASHWHRRYRARKHVTLFWSAVARPVSRRRVRAVRALEEKRVRPDVISAVFIGALNGAIVGSRRGCASHQLAHFWRDLSIALPNCANSPMHETLLLGYTF
ncbi:patatin-like phospholipase domain-containing protein [Paraburkholderia diazotrophica]|uniref:Uncharacterized protein n=1 Tax=Paraburkholderia diazotrophica TaxID=667676 RepID=A0A1H7EB81_9BURK|nr:hypothetical protein [Paraburkholderia diazotrophica]SEK10894.1 hypothetical protein SAMN05192539_104939 [Paraburkholderia diazotrophica]